MLNISDIRKLLIQEVVCRNIKETGYDCLNGNRYVEIRNVVFECDEDCIFAHIPKLPYMEDDWYEKNYDPLLYNDDQLIRCLNKIADNPNTRQAVIIMSSTDNLQCTMYMHVSLLKNKGEYELEYSVHMRSNDAVEFRTDYQWHKQVYAKVGETVELDCLLVCDDKGKVEVGSPLTGKKAVCEVLEQGKEKKVIAFRYHAKKNVRRRQGHRQPYSKLKVVSIG